MKTPNPLGVYLRTMRKPQHESELPLFDPNEQITPPPEQDEDEAVEVGEWD